LLFRDKILELWLLAIMHRAVRREIFVSVLLLSVLVTCVSEEQQESFSKLYSNLTTEIWSADSREAEGVEKAEERTVEERKEGMNIGECCWHYCFC
jgi:maltose-binding protein MalE